MASHFPNLECWMYEARYLEVDLAVMIQSTSDTNNEHFFADTNNALCIWIWYDNVSHPKLVDYKKDQNWVQKSGDYFIFPGSGTQFKEGSTSYIEFVEKALPKIEFSKHIQVVLDVGCGVVSFGGYTLDKDVITMSFAPKDEHEAQIQFHWDADGWKPLLELNKILRPGGFFVWSATPVYRDNERDRNIWKGFYGSSTESMCWKVVAKTVDASGIGLVIYQKPVSYSCYKQRKDNYPPLVSGNKVRIVHVMLKLHLLLLSCVSYVPLSNCISRLPVGGKSKLYNWPAPWPQRLSSKPPSLSAATDAEEAFNEDTKHWSALVFDVYLEGLAKNWSSVRNVMDMNSSYGGFAAALIDRPVWVMNVVAIDAQDTLCLCDIRDVAAEMDQLLRPGGYVLVQDAAETINKFTLILRSLHWSLNPYEDHFLVGQKGFWRPTAVDI
ncbi:hypothetical protein EZV62_024737 [Acer yangbiense]|uniref:Methyltransferase n=1 Tax=Acer yangbiense TaxID=1000413 RepID=A0A5C7GX08_9ROSI|nr:hypothetical protein EZV62_024737 [Acer yangbiense]